MISNTNTSIGSPVRQVSARVEHYQGSTLVQTWTNSDRLIEITIERVGDESRFFGYGICQKANIHLIDVNKEITNYSTQDKLDIRFSTRTPTIADYGFVKVLPNYQITKCHRDENTNELSITGYDALYYASNHRFAELGLVAPYTTADIANAIAKLLLGQNGRVVKNTESIGWNIIFTKGANYNGDETLRDVLDDIAEATQSIYFIEGNGGDHLCFKTLKNETAPALTISKDDYISLRNRENRRLGGITHITELGDNVGTTGTQQGTIQYIRDNPLWNMSDNVNTYVDAAWNLIKELTINQFDMTWRGNFYLSLGDRFGMIGKDNNIFYSFLLNDVWEYDGAFRQKTSWAYTNTDTETESAPSTLGDLLKDTYAKVNKVDGVIELMAKETIKDKESYEERFSSLILTADGISQEVSRIEEKVDSTTNTLNSKIDQTASSITSKITQVETKHGQDISNLSSSITQTANTLTSEISKIDKKIDDTSTTLNTKITQTQESISTEVGKVETKLNNAVSTFNTKFTQTESSVSSAVQRVEQIGKQTSEWGSLIEQTADAIELKVDKNGIISAINMSPESIDISSDKINLSGYTTFTDLSTYGKTTINGSNITTGTISADRLNLTGAISWGDLDSDTQDALEDIEDTANAAYLLAAQNNSVTLPNYIKSTYIDSTEIRSPTLKGNDIKVYNTFQTIGYNGTTEIVTGYIGAAKGEDASYNTTYGVAMSNEWNPTSYHVGDNYVIVTNAGVRLQSGNNNVVVTNNTIRINAETGKAYYNGVEIGGADYVVETGTSGIWTYRKWNSGIAECWGKRSVSTTINTAWGSLYTSGALSGTDVALPFTFAEVPNVNVSLYNNAAGAFIMVSGSWNPPTTTTTGAYELARGNALTTSYSFGFNYQVMGRWK